MKRWRALSVLVMPVLVMAVLVMTVVATACGGGGPADEEAAGPDEPGPSEVSAPGERAVQVVGAGKVRLFGTFTTPPAAQSASVPGVLLVPTIGPGDRNGLIGPSGAADRLGEDLASALSAAGVASFRYDGRGTGESRLGTDVRLRFDDLVADARAALDLLAERKETAVRDLAVVGYDLGGLVATRLAATDARVKRLVLISTPAGSAANVQAAQLRAVGGPALEDAVRSTVANLLATRTLPPLDDLPAALRPLFPEAEAPFLAELYGLDGAAEAAKVKVPSLIVSSAAAEAAYGTARLVAAIPAAQTVTSPGSPTLLLTGPLPIESVPSFSHPLAIDNAHGAALPPAPTTRDAETVGRITAFLAG